MVGRKTDLRLRWTLAVRPELIPGRRLREMQHISSPAQGLLMEIDRQVLVCQYVNCIANGSKEVLEAFQTHPVAGVEVIAVGCQGQCNMGATVRILPDETWYCRVKPEDVSAIVEQHLKQGELVDRLLHPRMHPRFGGGY